MLLSVGENYIFLEPNICFYSNIYSIHKRRKCSLLSSHLTFLILPCKFWENTVNFILLWIIFPLFSSSLKHPFYNLFYQSTDPLAHLSNSGSCFPTMFPNMVTSGNLGVEKEEVSIQIILKGLPAWSMHKLRCSIMTLGFQKCMGFDVLPVSIIIVIPGDNSCSSEKFIIPLIINICLTLLDLGKYFWDDYLLPLKFVHGCF